MSPQLYNRHLCYYSKNDKFLLCQSDLIKNTISISSNKFQEPKFSPWKDPVLKKSYKFFIYFFFKANDHSRRLVPSRSSISLS